ncbi:MAG: response regulator [Clostridia bacterium]|nr:response regulator [Clostridia bacterium]
MNILVVDDDVIICNGTAGRIRRMAFPEVETVACAYSGREALNKMKSLPYGILLTDIRMEGMDGLELVRQVREACPQTVCIIMTAYDQFSYAQQAIRLGVKDFLVKPCAESAMRALIESVLSVAAEETLPREEEPVDGEAILPQAEAYIQNHLYDQISMAEVANHFNLSYSYFSRLFHQYTGKTFIRYLTQSRMEEACRRMLSGEKMNDISKSLGYQNAANFTRAFSREFGMSPARWLEKNGSRRNRLCEKPGD